MRALLTPDRVLEIADSLERMIRLARTVDFEVLDSRREAVATLMIEARFFGELCDDDDLDPFQTSGLVMEAMRKRRGLPRTQHQPPPS